MAIATKGPLKTTDKTTGPLYTSSAASIESALREAHACLL